MVNIIKKLSEQTGINYQQAKSALNLVSKAVLENVSKNNTSKLLSNLPSEISSNFSAEEKEKFLSSEQDMDNKELSTRVGKETGINESEKSENIVKEAVKLLQPLHNY